MTTRCVDAFTSLKRSVGKPKKEKREVLRIFQSKSLVEDDPIYVGELALNPLTHRDHSLPSSQNISTHLGFLWPINASYLDHVKGTPRENPYAFGLKSVICGKERDFVSNRLHS